MTEHCDAIVITCMDYRLHRRTGGRDVVGQFVESLGRDCDVISRGGACQDLVRPAGAGDPALLRDLQIAVERHGVNTIYLLNHENCGAYADMSFPSRDEELTRHWQDLRAARDLLQRQFPHVRVQMCFAELAPGSHDEYHVIHEPPSESA